MEEIDYSVETDEETDEDAFIAAYSDEEVKKLLIAARKNSDIKLRRVLKELLYVRWIRHI